MRSFHNKAGQERKHGSELGLPKDCLWSRLDYSICLTDLEGVFRSEAVSSVSLQPLIVFILELVLNTVACENPFFVGCHNTVNLSELEL